QATEPLFYQQLAILAKQVDDHRTCPPEIAEAWVKNIRSICYETFDTWVLEADAEDLDMKRITQARRFLGGKLKN
ncbi:MAG: type I-E CRISPR-associated protein Cse1/CasA, partial [Alteromonadaceae bacterium]